MSNKNSKTSKIIFTILLIVGVILVLIGFLGFVYCAYKMVTDSIFNLGVSPVSFFIPFVIGSVLATIGQKELRRIHFESKTNEQMQTSTFEQNVQNSPETENQNKNELPTKCPNCSAPTNNNAKCEYCGTILTKFAKKEDNTKIIKHK